VIWALALLALAAVVAGLFVGRAVRTKRQIRRRLRRYSAGLDGAHWATRRTHG
jgi:NADH:ubiquinone oxidoreductase subunit 3 (subunit A)